MQISSSASSSLRLLSSSGLSGIGLRLSSSLRPVPHRALGTALADSEDRTAMAVTTSLPPANAQQQHHRGSAGLQASSSNLSLSTSNGTSSSPSDSFLSPTGETEMGAVSSRLGSAHNGASEKAKGKRAVRDDSDQQYPANLQGDAVNDMDIMASPTKRQRRDKSTVTLGVESAMKASKGTLHMLWTGKARALQLT